MPDFVVIQPPGAAALHDRSPNDNDRFFRRFPVYIVAVALIWSGMLAFVPFLWAAYPQPVVMNPGDRVAALAVVAMGVSILASHSHARVSRAAALLGLATSLSLATFGTLREDVSSELPAWCVLSHDVVLHCAAMALTCLAIYCSTGGAWFRRLGRIMAIAAIIGALGHRGTALWLYGAENGITLDSMHRQVVLLVLAACAAFALSRRHERDSLFDDRTDFAIALLGAFVAVFAWYVITEQNRSRIHAYAASAASEVERHIGAILQDQAGLVRRMGERWEAIGGLPPRPLLEFEMQSYLRDIPPIVTMAVLEPDGSPYLFAGWYFGSRDWIRKRLAANEIQELSRHARDSGEVHVSKAMPHPSGNPHALVVVPLASGIAPGWFLVAELDIAVLLSRSMSPDFESVRFRILQDDWVVYDGVPADSPAIRVSERSVALHHGAHWRLSAWHIMSGVLPSAIIFPDLILLVCLLFTFFLLGFRRQSASLWQRSCQIYHNLMHDGLTGLPNRLYIQQRLRQVGTHGAPVRCAIWVVVIEIDDIKLINDTLGHPAGDRVMQLVAERLCAQLGGRSFLGRLGDQDFAVLFETGSHEEITAATGRMLSIISMPYHVENMELRLTANAGIAQGWSDEEAPLELLTRADLALRRARLQGRGGWHEYTAELSRNIGERLQLHNELDAALEADALTMLYQPLIDGQTGRIVAVEALLRWTHQALGSVSPSVFIPLAEESGLIYSLNRWAMDRACNDISALRERIRADFPVVINISPAVFQRSDFIVAVKSMLAAHGLPAECLEFEINERTMLTDLATTRKTLQQLNDINIKVSVDGFGTGYSSLNHLRSLPIHKIKIGRPFVHHVVTNRSDAAIVKAMIGLAHHLELKVVACDVDAASQFWFLKRNRCDAFQGDLFAPAMALNDIAQRLMEQGGREKLPEAMSSDDDSRTLLLVDDEENILRALTRVLRRDGYRILTARSPTDALALLAQNRVQVVVSDQRMPDMSGTEFFSHVKDMYPETVRLVLSGYTDLKSVTDAINRGSIYKFLTKPWDDVELRREVARAFHIQKSSTE